MAVEVTSLFGTELGNHYIRNLGTVLAENLGIKDTETYASGGQVAAHGQFHCGETVIGQEVCSRDDGEDIDPGRKTPYSGDVGLGKRRPAQQRVCGDWRLENDWFELRL